MNISGIPIIVIISYMIGEIYKVIFNKNKNLYKLIPIVVAISGGLLGMIMYITKKEMIYDASNIYVALEIGIISGASATGTNEIIKQVFYKDKEEKGNEKNV